MVLSKNFIVFFLLLLLLSCSDESEPTIEPNTDPTVLAKDSVTIDNGVTYQKITGFGGCNGVFRGVSNFPNAGDFQNAFGTGDNELGFTMFRVSVPADSSDWPAIADVALLAKKHDPIIFASPWNAPPFMLDPTKEEKVILPSMYDRYVEHLNAFDNYMASRGVDLFAISVQNEPDIGEWTQWSTEEVYNFMRNHAADINNRVITPESFNFNRSYYNQLLMEDDVNAHFDIVGGHIYGNGLGEFPLAEEKNKEIWMTEYLLNEFTDQNPNDSWRALTNGAKWDQSIDMLTSIHVSMESNWNAYIWWYLKRYYGFIGDGLEGSVDGAILKRGYAFSHFSKFVRPGYVRIGVQQPESSVLDITAYTDGATTVVVVLNPTIVSLDLRVLLPGENFSSMEAYRTDLTNNRELINVGSEGESIEVIVTSKSITTVLLKS